MVAVIGDGSLESMLCASGSDDDSSGCKEGSSSSVAEYPSGESSSGSSGSSSESESCSDFSSGPSSESFVSSSQSGTSGSSLNDPGDGSEEYSDLLAERLIELSSVIPSRQAMHLGKFLLRNGVEEGLASYVVDNFTSMTLSRSQSVRASRLFRKWFSNHGFLRKSYSRSEFQVIGDTVKSRVDSLVSAIPGVVSSDESYLVGSRLLDLQSEVAVDSLEHDLEIFGRYARVLPKLPDPLKDVFYDSLDRSIEINRGKRDIGTRRRYNHLGSLLEHLGSFTGKHCRSAYGLVRKLHGRDTRNILHKLYDHVGALPYDTPDTVIGVVDDVIGLIPEAGCLDDDVVVEVDSFLGMLVDSFRSHAAFEVGTFFALCRNLYADQVYEDTHSDVSSAVSVLQHHPSFVYDEFSFDEDCDGEYGVDCGGAGDDSFVDEESSDQSFGILNDYGLRLSLLTASATARIDDAQVVWPFDDENNLEERIKYIALEYLKMSRDIIDKHGVGKACEFAVRVCGFNNVGNGPAQVLQDMELYKKGVVDMLPLSDEEEDLLGRAILRERKETTSRREVSRRYRSVIDDGPVDCPDDLRAHLLEDLKVEVDKVWDFRRNQFTLYFDRAAADNYDKLRRRKIDHNLIRKTAQELHELDLLEKHVLWYGGGCGFGKSEVAFYEELKRLGYDVHMDLVDRSRVMLSRAALLCARKGIDVDIFELDLEKLNMKDLEKDRQVIFGLWGGTAFNWVERYITFKRYHTIFRKRDSLDEEGRYRYPRFYGDSDRRKDILLVEGDLVKDTAHYRDALSQLFLANGLAGEYGLTPDVLTDEGGNLCHTVYFKKPDVIFPGGVADPGRVDESGFFVRPNNDIGELQCIYLVTKNKDPFEKGQAILVIDSGTLHEDEFNWHMGSLDYDSYFISGARNNAVAVCRLTDGLKPFLRRK